MLVSLFKTIPVYAETGIKLSPPQFDLVLQSSQPSMRQFTIENIGESPIEVRLDLIKPSTIPDSLSVANRITLSTPSTYTLKPDEKRVNEFEYDRKELPEIITYFAIFEITAQSLEETFGFDELNQSVSLSVKISMRNSDTIVPNYIYVTDLLPMTILSAPGNKDVSLAWTNATPETVTASTRLIITNRLNPSERYAIENSQKELGVLDGSVLGKKLGFEGFWPKWYSLRSDFLTEKGENHMFASDLLYVSWQSVVVFIVGILFILRLLTVFSARKRYLMENEVD